MAPERVFEQWDSFYVITGGAAAGLIGLLFVVVTLNGGRDRAQALRAVSIYMTPTVVNFAVVLATSAVAVAPQHTVLATAAVLGVGTLVGLANASWACIAMRSRTPGNEPPHWSDFWLYGAAPFAICLSLAAADAALWAQATWAVYAIAGLMLGLLMLGIRNAWDLVTWLAPQRGGGPDQPVS